jgi:Spx/MgsR family transcriptional regulator
MALTLYGIPNCDTVKKARTWLAQKGRDVTFHDFRKDGLSRAKVEQWLATVPAGRLLTRRGTTWRKLDAAQQARAESDLAGLLIDHPSLIKRPVIETGDTVLVGFTDAERMALEG